MCILVCLFLLLFLHNDETLSNLFRLALIMVNLLKKEDLKNKYDVPNINESKKDRNIKLSDFDFGDELNFSQN